MRYKMSGRRRDFEAWAAHHFKTNKMIQMGELRGAHVAVSPPRYQTKSRTRAEWGVYAHLWKQYDASQLKISQVSSRMRAALESYKLV